MPTLNIPPGIRVKVRSRAEKCCEYCKSKDKYSPHSFTIDHIVPTSFNGTGELNNLAYACFLCNRLKSNKFKVYDRPTNNWIPLFNPRKNSWDEHFVWDSNATHIIGITPVGRCTIKELKLNREKLIEYRNCLIPFGLHP
jgi:hypothetical protein